MGTPEFVHNVPPPQHPLEGCERLLGAEFSTQPPPTLLSLFPLFIFLKKKEFRLKEGVRWEEGVEEVASKKEEEARQMKTRVRHDKN